MYNWKINMKNGDVHIIKTKYNNLEDLRREIFGKHLVQISAWELKDTRSYDEFGSVDSIAIVSTDVSSIEYYCGK